MSHRDFWAAAIAAATFGGCPAVLAKAPECTNPNGWATSMAYTSLRGAGLVDSSMGDSTLTKVTRIASEKIGKDLYRQVHLIEFRNASGKGVTVMTVNDASSRECSMSEVSVYLVSQTVADGRLSGLKPQ